MKTSELYLTEDEILIQEIKNGDKEVFGELYRKYYPKVHRKCYSFTRNPSEASDLAQDILLKTFEYIHSFRGESKFSTWLYSITNNHCIEYIRKKNHHPETGLDEGYDIPDTEGKEEDGSAPEEMFLLLNKSLETLSSEEKELLYLKYEKNLSVKEIQGFLNLSASAVKMRLKRARDKVERNCEFRQSGIRKQLNHVSGPVSEYLSIKYLSLHPAEYSDQF